MALGRVPESPYLFIESTICELVVTLFIACAVALLTSKTPPAYSLYIARPRLTLLSSPTRLRAIFGPASLGCTSIRGATIHAACGEGQGGWYARIDASFVPYTYLWRGYLSGRHFDVLAHEREHLRDIQSDATQYVRTLSLQTFRSQSDCATVMERNSADFRERVHRFAERSQRDRQ